MNRRTILVSSGIAAVGIFGLGAYMYVPSVEKNAIRNAADETFLVRSHAPVLGPVDAPVTIVEFFDPACEACRAFHPYVKDIMSNFEGKVRVIEQADEYIPRLRKLNPDVLAVTSDHSTPSLLKSHSWHPNPLIIHSRTALTDQVSRFAEKDCAQGYLGRFTAKHVMPLLLAHSGKLEKYGA